MPLVSLAGNSGSINGMPTLLWFRRDLRLHDLPAAAGRRGGRRRGAGLLRPRPAAEDVLGAAAAAVPLRRAARAARRTRRQAAGDARTPGEANSRAGQIRRRDGACMSRPTSPRSAVAATTPSATRSATSRWKRPGRRIWSRRAGSSRTTANPYKVFTPFYDAWRKHGWRAPAKSGPKSANWIDPADAQGRCRHPRRRGRTRPARR